MVKVSVLGSTGSIGTSTLDVISRLGRSFAVAGLAAGKNIPLLSEQIERFRPGLVSVERREDAVSLRSRFRGRGLRVAFGPEGAEEVASLPANDIVVAAITGTNGLRPTLAAVRAGVRVALANKESMVVAGALLRAAAARSGAKIIPVDSEHSALFQSMVGHDRRHIRRLILTASGGPFFSRRPEELLAVTPEEAVKHPRWNMGKKISVDSATLMNKALEIIEARWLFDVPGSRIAVLIHPQSIVHSMVEYIDGSIVAQLGVTDMRTPIAYALAYPERIEDSSRRLDLAGIGGGLTFFEADEGRFLPLALAREALDRAGTMPAVLSAANEAAVELFLARKIPFPSIVTSVQAVMKGHETKKDPSLSDLIEVDRWAREQINRIGERI